MISRVFGHILGSVEEADTVVENERCEELLEFEDGEWVIIDIQDNATVGLTVEDPLENLLIEHPSMSVYQMRHQTGEEDSSDEEDDSPRSVPIRRDILWHLAPSSDFLFPVQRARMFTERRNLSRNALNRQNLVKTRFCPAERRYGHFKQPSQRLYNY
ncbi:tumor protein p53-inducible nuclear protein 1 isoform X2 [Trichomycterus rosablanca]